TCVRQIARVWAASATPWAAGCMEVRIGTAIPHEITRPVSIAIPTDSPTRCPAPRSASDQAMSYPLEAEAPTWKKPVTSAAAGRGSDGLDDVVLEDRRVLDGAQDGHRDHRRGDRGGEGEADLEAEVDVRRREDRGDERAENEAAYRELSGVQGR